MKKLTMIITLHSGIVEGTRVCRIFNKRLDLLQEVFFYSADKRTNKEIICDAVNEDLLYTHLVCKISDIHKITEKLYYAIIP